MAGNGVSFAAAAEMAGPARVGTALGLQNTILFVAVAIAPPAFGARRGRARPGPPPSRWPPPARWWAGGSSDRWPRARRAGRARYPRPAPRTRGVRCRSSSEGPRTKGTASCGSGADGRGSGAVASSCSASPCSSRSSPAPRSWCCRVAPTRRAAYQAMSLELESLANRHATHEWQAIAERRHLARGRPGARVVMKRDEQSCSPRMASLRGPGAVREVRDDLTTYSAYVDRELALLDLELFDHADRWDEARVDPAYEAALGQPRADRRGGGRRARPRPSPSRARASCSCWSWRWLRAGLLLRRFAAAAQLRATSRSPRTRCCRASEARFRALIQHASDVVTLVDARRYRRLPEPVGATGARDRPRVGHRAARHRAAPPRRRGAARGPPVGDDGRARPRAPSRCSSCASATARAGGVPPRRSSRTCGASPACGAFVLNTRDVSERPPCSRSSSTRRSTTA